MEGTEKLVRSYQKFAKSYEANLGDDFRAVAKVLVFVGEVDLGTNQSHVELVVNPEKRKTMTSLRIRFKRTNRHQPKRRNGVTPSNTAGVNFMSQKLRVKFLLLEFL